MCSGSDGINEPHAIVESINKVKQSIQQPRSIGATDTRILCQAVVSTEGSRASASISRNHATTSCHNDYSMSTIRTDINVPIVSIDHGGAGVIDGIAGGPITVSGPRRVSTARNRGHYPIGE